jgi:VWFA-related protein
MEVDMRKTILIALLISASTGSALSQQGRNKPDYDQPIRIGTELVQIDVVVTDRSGKIVSGLTKDDFALYDKGKKQLISFFEFVDAGNKKGRGGEAAQTTTQPVSPQGPTEADVKRIFAFVIDDLTIKYEDLNYLRQMLTNFVDNQMQPTDLVAIVRTVGGKGLLQQFTTDKNMLRLAVNSLTVATHPFSAFHNPRDQRIAAADLQPAGGGGGGAPQNLAGALDTAGESIDIDDPQEDTNKTLRALMTLGTASFIIDGLKQLHGRKSLILISGGLPILSAQQGAAASNISNFLDQLGDKATRSGVAIHTMDVRGLQAQIGVASFEDTPARSAMGGGAPTGFGRKPDESLLGDKNPFDALDAHQGLRTLSATTGGLSILNRNDFSAGLEKIVLASDGYYLLAYTPAGAKFDGDFHKLEVKVKGDYKVYSRRGYFAREDKPSVAPATKQEEMLAAVKSPLSRRDIDLDAVVLYKSAAPKQGAIDVNLVIEPKKLRFDEVGGKQQADLDIVGFVFDELGKIRGGFSEAVTTSLTPEEMNQVGTAGLTYSANTTLPSGLYQIRLAVRDNKTGNIGTLSRLLEVPDLEKGRLSASSLLLGAVPQKDMSAAAPTPVTANRRVSRKQDLRYAAIIYNAKSKDGKPQVRTQLVISQNGQVVYKEPEEPLAGAGNNPQLLKVGQLGLGGVKPGRYTLSLIITDPLADKRAQTITRSMDFVVTN